MCLGHIRDTKSAHKESVRLILALMVQSQQDLQAAADRGGMNPGQCISLRSLFVCQGHDTLLAPSSSIPFRRLEDILLIHLNSGVM